MLKLKDPALLRFDGYIGGEWRPARSGKRFAVRNPATGELLAEVTDMDAADATGAVEDAFAAFAAWRAKTAKERARLMRGWFDLIMANQEDLAQLMTAEQGKPLAESRGEIAYGASFIEWFAEEG
jgi:succinate-semialdehyde dehydrogenase/glutarate-semialdehyde dehydrogenase